jgi:hypothetical protein
MSSREAAPRLGGMLALAWLGSLLLGAVHSVHAQDGTQGAPYTSGVLTEVGGGWLVSLEAATLAELPLSSRSRDEQQILLLTVQVQNVGTEPRLFPVSRLRVLSSSGAALRDTWCGRDSKPLELSGQIPPHGTLTGDACWTMGAADVSNVVLYLEPPLGEARQPVFFGVGPAEIAVARVVPTAAPTALSISVDTVGGGVPSVPLAPPRDASGPPDSGANSIVRTHVDGGRTQTPVANARCAPVYSAYADSQGSYLTEDCPVAGGSREGPGAAIRAAGVSPAELYPSANQPPGRSGSTFGATPTPVSTGTPPSTSQMPFGSIGERR